MKVHLIKAKTVRTFAQTHAASAQSFEEWINKVNSADWETPNDMKQTFGSVDLLGRGSSRAVFNVAGNNFRIICKYQFGNKMVHLFVSWIGTHAEYDKLNKEGRQFTIEKF